MQTTDADTGQVAGMSRERYTDQVLAVLREAIDRTLDEYERTGTAAPAPASYATALAGVLVPSPDDNPLAELLGPFWSSLKVRSALGVPTRQALASRIESGSILAVRTSDGRLLFPVCQFILSGDQIIVRPGLARMFSVLREADAWSVAVATNTPADELDGLSPVEWTRAGRDDDALEDLARRIASEWSR